MTDLFLSMHVLFDTRLYLQNERFGIYISRVERKTSVSQMVVFPQT